MMDPMMELGQQAYRDVDETIRTTLRQLATKHKMTSVEPVQEFVVWAVVPVFCQIIEELGASMGEDFRRQWAEQLREAADHLDRETS